MNGNDLIKWGFKPGAWFKDALPQAQEMRAKGCTNEQIFEVLRGMQPVELELRTNTLPFSVYLTPRDDAERENHAAVITHMDNLMRVPTIQRGAVMPDACPAGAAPGTIPVGGVVACENAIHPGFHSADICCSVAISILKRRVHTGQALDAAQRVTHFGPGGRHDNGADRHEALLRLVAGFKDNPFLAGLETRALHHFMTQGDGNHFFFLGEVNGHMAMVTHHGSRGLGADLYKRGKACAERMTKAIAPRVPRHQAWIPADTDEGRDYWAALQVVRAWTKLNHFEIHDTIARKLGVKVEERFWNEHNFVFRKSDGLFYHAKGATPNFSGFSEDDAGLTLIPLNMAAGILVADHSSDFQRPSGALEFCPHGAGRNFSRTQHMRALTERYGDDTGLTQPVIDRIFKDETRDIDARFWNGKPDLSELPSAYKNADQIHNEIKGHSLAKIRCRIAPLGSIMAGNDDRDWRKIKAAKKAKQEEAS